MPPDAHAAVLLGKLGKVALERFTERLASLGLRPHHYAVLDALAGRELASQQELGRLLGQAPSGIVPILDDLERLGAVRRVRDDADRRRHVLALTPRGRELLADAAAVAEAVDDEMLEGIGPEQREALVGLLRGVARRAGILPVGD